ncbi:MAG: flagellar basal-body rod protein FlgG [candidate division Zixibacteria bacterium]|nr:flagellar basal-body rod protein FlgG [candidate division Zixibacteria bacterium]
MIKAMNTAATGMVAQQMNIDNIANNLANVNTTGFKKGRVEFQDILYQNYRKAGTASAVGTTVPVSLDVGYGARAVATSREFSSGSVTVTGNATDLAIGGNGFFQIQMPDGTTSYTRDGSFKISAEGDLVTADGFQVQPTITIPQDATEVSVTIDGQAFVAVIGNETPQQIGQLELARFINPAGLSAVGHNLYTETAASGTPITGTPATDGFGRIDQGSLEASNVSVVDEMVNMIMAQRSYEINSKVIQTSDEMSQTTNNLKR